MYMIHHTIRGVLSFESSPRTEYSWEKEVMMWFHQVTLTIAAIFDCENKLLRNKFCYVLKNQSVMVTSSVVCSYCYVIQWCCEAPTVPNGVGVRPDTHPNALGKRWGNYLYISIQKRPVYELIRYFCKEDQVERAYLCWIESKFLLTWS